MCYFKILLLKLKELWSHSVDRYPAVCMHGDKSQNERDYVLRGMHKSKMGMSFSTLYL